MVDELSREYLVKKHGKDNLTDLDGIGIYAGQIRKIDSNAFEGLTKLEKLWLSNNRIEEIEVRSFEGLSNLKELWLDNNKLKEIDRKCFEPLKSIELIALYENEALNAVSFIKQSNSIEKYDKERVNKFGSVSDWNEFLQQFPEKGNNNY